MSGMCCFTGAPLSKRLEREYETDPCDGIAQGGIGAGIAIGDKGQRVDVDRDPIDAAEEKQRRAAALSQQGEYDRHDTDQKIELADPVQDRVRHMESGHPGPGPVEHPTRLDEQIGLQKRERVLLPPLPQPVARHDAVGLKAEILGITQIPDFPVGIKVADIIVVRILRLGLLVICGEAFVHHLPHMALVVERVILGIALALVGAEQKRISRAVGERDESVEAAVVSQAPGDRKDKEGAEQRHSKTQQLPSLPTQQEPHGGKDGHQYDVGAKHQRRHKAQHIPDAAAASGTAEQAAEQQPDESGEQTEENDPEAEAAEAPAAGIRPEYRALDCVEISDEAYKGIEISLYPAADSSEEAQNAYWTAVDTAIMTRLFNLYPVKEYPAALLEYVTGSLEESYRQYADMYGLDFGQFLSSYMNMDEESFLRETDEAAKQTLHQEILLKAIAEKENLTVSDQEFEDGCAQYAVKYGYDSADALKAAFDEPTLRISLLMDKTLDFLEKEAHIHEIIETESESESATEAEF